jgi:16S rRNA (guanine1207-N2)-methyltransferase
VPELLRTKVRAPLAIALGSPAEVVHCVASLGGLETTCYQMDLHQAERLRAELADAQLSAHVVTAPDLWDLPAGFQSALYLPARGGERELKIDMVEQAFHVLRPHGTFFVWSPHETDPFFPTLLKKIFGRIHAPNIEGETVLWCSREGERPRRRHEVTFQARIADGPACRFRSRPGVFSYGRFDNGARALAETMTIRPGDRVLDLGCGCGTNGIFAAQRAGPGGQITFVDSNVRAIALTEINARENGVASFQALASSKVEGLDEGSFDVVLANPPYYAGSSIARLFIERSRALLKPDGRLYLVTKQPTEVADLMMEVFDQVGVMLHRGYTILTNTESLE